MSDKKDIVKMLELFRWPEEDIERKANQILALIKSKECPTMEEIEEGWEEDIKYIYKLINK